MEVDESVSEKKRKQGQSLEEPQHLKARQTKRSLWRRLRGSSQRDGRKTRSMETGKEERREL